MHKAEAPVRGDDRGARRPAFFWRRRLSRLAWAAALGVAGFAGCKARVSEVRQSSTGGAPPYRLTDLGNALTSVAFAADGLRGWAVGPGGAILRTSDGGRTWARTEGVPVNVELDSVAFSADGKRGCAVGGDGAALGNGAVLLTDDGGQTWKQARSVPPTGSLRSVALSADGQRIWIATRKLGGLLLSVDGGLSWKPSSGVYPGEKIESVAFSPDGRHGLAAGQDGLMKFSDDGGQTWKAAFGVSNSEYLQSVAFSADGEHAWAVGDYGAIYESENRGNAWIKALSPTSLFLNSVAFAPDGKRGLIGGDEGTILRTLNGGLTWQYVGDVPTEENIFSVGIGPDGEQGWAAGSTGTVLITHDAGLTWQKAAGSPTESQLKSVAFAGDGKRGLAIGAPGTFLLTVDGGLTWQAPAGVPRSAQMNAVTLSEDGRLGWAVGALGTILRSADGGQHWEKVAERAGEHHLNAVAAAADGLRVWAVGDLGLVMGSTDGGRTWQEHPGLKLSSGFPLAQNLSGVAFKPDGRRGWAVGTFGTILRTTDGGQTWRLLEDFPTERNLRSVAFAPDGLHGLASGDAGTVLRTSDGGETWTLTNSEKPAVTLTSVALASDGRNGWAVGGDGYILRTADGGDYWWVVGHEPSYGSVNAVAVSADGLSVWAVGDYGTILRTSSSPGDSRPFQGTLSVSLSTHDGIIQPWVVIDSPTLVQAVTLHITLSGPRATGDLAKGFVRTFDYYHWAQGWKADELGDGVYTCHVEASDGWNIVTEDFQFGNGIWLRLKEFMGWDIALSQPGVFAKDHGTQNLVLLLVLYCLAIAGLFVFRPSLFVLWHEKAAPLIAALPLPSKATDKVTQLAGLFLITRARALNAVVAEFAPRALAEIEKLPEAAARHKWIAAPIQVEDEEFGRTSSPFGATAPVPTDELYIRGLTELKRHLVNRRWWLSIEGPGGVGKSALAFQLARWFAGGEARARLHMPQAIPIYVRSLKEGLDTEVLAELKRITELPRMSPQLSGALLSKRRVLALVDGVSEKTSDIEALELGPLNPAKGAVLTHLAVLTSRRRIQIPEVVKVLPKPVDLGTIDEVLSRYLDDVVGAGRFTPAQREAIRETLKGIMKEMSHEPGQTPQIPMVFVKLIIQRADEVLATDDKSETTERAEEALPKDLAELVDGYVASLLEARTDTVSEAAQARRAALVCVGSDGIPKLRPLAAYEARSLTLAQLEGLVTTGHMVKDAVDVGDPRYKFALDPIAEYLAAKELVMAVRDGRMTLADLKALASQFAAGSDVTAKVILIGRTLGVTVA